eukprot:4610954-Prymnesium_polylepis.2
MSNEDGSELSAPLAGGASPLALRSWLAAVFLVAVFSSCGVRRHGHRNTRRCSAHAGTRRRMVHASADGGWSVRGRTARLGSAGGGTGADVELSLIHI